MSEKSLRNIERKLFSKTKTGNDSARTAVFKRFHHFFVYVFVWKIARVCKNINAVSVQKLFDGSRNRSASGLTEFTLADQSVRFQMNVQHEIGDFFA